MNKQITLAVLLGAIASLAIAGVGAASVNADINNPKGDLRFQNTKTVIVNLKGGKDGKDGKDGNNGENGVNGRDGTNGRNGTDGINGLSGQNGTNGKDGLNGLNGTNGINGQDGKNGTDGAPGRDGRNGTDGVNGIDGRDGQMVLVLNVSNGQHIVCSGDAGGNIGCVDTSDNGTVIIPPVDNQTGNTTNPGGNTTEPVVCGEGETNVNGTCVTTIPPIDDNQTIPPITNETGNETGPVVVDNSTGTVVIDNQTNSTG